MPVLPPNPPARRQYYLTNLDTGRITSSLSLRPETASMFNQSGILVSRRLLWVEKHQLSIFDIGTDSDPSFFIHTPQNKCRK